MRRADDIWRTHGHYYLAAMERTGGDPAFNIILGREVSAEELAWVKHAHGALSELWPRQVLADLSEATMSVAEGVAHLEDLVRSHARLTSDDTRRMEATLRSWLAHFGAFDQHLPNLVRKHFGRQQMARTKEHIATVKSNDYSYRLSLALRNVALHRRSVITDTQYTNSRDGLYGLTLAITPTLLAHGDDRADSALTESAAAIDVDHLARQGFLAAERVLVQVLDTLRVELYDRIHGLELIAREVIQDEESQQARIVYVTPHEGEEIEHMTMHDVPTAYRLGYDDFFLQASPLLDSEPATITPEDMARGGT